MQAATNFHERKNKITGKGKTQRLRSVVAKIQMDDTSPDEEELEKSDNNDTDFASESDSSDSDYY